MWLDVIVPLMGGLGLFLYGMSTMTNGIEKAAGARLRMLLDIVTKNRFVGMLAGLVFTAVIQSSSAATVMVVSFVNSGLTTLSQAAGLILGANIGTTVTAHLISFKLSDIAPVIVMAGVIMVNFCKKPRIQKIGEVVLGFGILFIGLSSMSSAMSKLSDNTSVTNMMQSISNPFLAILLGFAVTAVLQSSSASVGITQIMAENGLLKLPICYFIAMGCNLGACVSALLASMNGKKNAKRAALIHLLFNVFGLIIIIIPFLFAMEPISKFLEYISGTDPTRNIANAHTIIRIVQVVAVFPFMGIIDRLTYKLVPGKDEKAQEFELKYIGSKNLFSPATAVVEATREMERMGGIAIKNLSDAMEALFSHDERLIEKVYKEEKNIDYMNRAITNYLVNVNQLTLPLDDKKIIGGLFHVVNDIERIGDHAENVIEAAVLTRESGITFSKEAKEELQNMFKKVVNINKYAIDMFSHNNMSHMQDVLNLENEIDDMEKELQHRHVERLTKNQCTPEAGMIFSDIVSGLERVADHATNIAFSISNAEADSDL